MKGNYYIIFRVSTTVFIFPQKRYSKTRKTISQLCVVKNFIKFFLLTNLFYFCQNTTIMLMLGWPGFFARQYA